jgi:thymidylate synthase (FAD)
MGDDLSVVNAARVSRNVESEELTEKDLRLLTYLSSHGHTSPYRHAFLTFEVKAPLLVARQWWKYVVGSDHTMDGWNEESKRFVQEEPEFHVPQEWRGATTKKQGSGESVGPEYEGILATDAKGFYLHALYMYNRALEMGVCGEQARLFLPAFALYTTWRWSCSLQSLMHFLNQRLDHDAQWEIQQYAKAVKELAQLKFPHALT